MTGEHRQIAATMRRDGASLRDPAGYVFEYGERIYRRLLGPAAKDWLAFADTRQAARLMDEGRLIRTCVAPEIVPANCASLDAPGSDVPPHEGLVLVHERVPVISYVQEWCFSLLRDAALLHLDLTAELLSAGWILKDASPSNVQWKDGRLCLIDVASIEPYRGGPWRAYGQFCCTMLFPLLVSAHAGLRLQPLLKGHGLAGMDAATASRLLRGMPSLKQGVWMHVRLQSWLQRLTDRRHGGELGSDPTASSVGADAVLSMVTGLRRVLSALPPPAPTAWTGYRFTSTYSEAQVRDKRATVEAWCAAHMRPGVLALDVGCNTGDYSTVLARHAGQVVSIDADMPCVDDLYRRGELRVLPLVVDASEPTPPGGWALAEQRAFADRIRPDWSIWLAVIHHLAIHNGVRLDEVVRRIVGTSPHLIVEFVAPEDEMVRALLAERAIERPDYNETQFLGLLRKLDVEVLDNRSITSTRTLYLLRREEAA